MAALISRHGWVRDVVPESAYNTLLSPLPRREGREGRGGGGALNKVIYMGRLRSKFRPKFCQNFHFWQKKIPKFLTEKCPFRIRYIDTLYPFHIPTASLNLSIPFNCWLNMNKSLNQNLFSTFSQPYNASVGPYRSFCRPKCQIFPNFYILQLVPLRCPNLAVLTKTNKNCRITKQQRTKKSDHSQYFESFFFEGFIEERESRYKYINIVKKCPRVSQRSPNTDWLFIVDAPFLN